MKHIDTGSYSVDELGEWQKELEILRRQAEFSLPLERSIWKNSGLSDGMSILDMGCGPGITSHYLAKDFKNSQVKGIDPSLRLLAYAELLKKSDPLGNLSFQQGDVYDVSLSGDAYDFIYCRLLFQHLRNPDLALENLKRMLKKGGRLCIVDIDDSFLSICPEPPDLKHLIARSVEAQMLEGGNRFIGSALPDLLNKAGFTDIAGDLRILSGRDMGMENFLRMNLEFRTERLPEEDREEALRELENTYSFCLSSGHCSAICGIFAYTAFKN